MRRLREDIRRYRWLLLAGCASLLLLRWWGLHGKPERIMELPGPGSGDGVIVSVHDGELLFAQTAASPFTLTAVRVSDNMGRDIVRDPTVDLAHRPNASEPIVEAWLEGPDIYYLVGRTMGNRAPAYMARPPTGRIPNAVRLPSNPTSAQADLYRVPLAGGAPRRLLTHLHSPRVVVSGRYVYWIDARPDEIWRVPAGATNRIKQIPHSDLMATPIAGGPARKIASGLLSSTPLMPGTDGVYWLTPHGAPALNTDLNHYDANSGKIRVVHDYRGGPLTELNGRLYWIESLSSDGAFTSPRFPRVNPSAGLSNATIVSSDLDGSDRRELVSLTNGPDRLYKQNGHLYAIVDEERKGGVRSVLYRLDLEPSPRLAQLGVFPLAEHGCIDGGYYYFSVDEEHENWLDWSKEGLHKQVTRILYRSRLPERI